MTITRARESAPRLGRYLNTKIFRVRPIRERCKGVHCVDLGKSFPTHMFLQNLASIQPRTSPVKFARSLQRRVPRWPPVRRIVASIAAAPAKFGSKFLKFFAKCWQILINSSKFLKKNVILELCKGLHCVDLGESFQTHIYLQNLASIQPRTSPPCRSPRPSRRSP